MNNFELDQLLKACPAPELGEAYWEAFPGQVTRRLRQRPLPRPARSGWGPQLAWGFGLAFGCFALGYFIGHQEESQGFTRTWLANQRELQVSLTHFPEHFRDYVLNEKGMRQLLPDQP